MTLGALPTAEMIDRAVYRRVADQLVGEFRMTLLARRDACYGALQISEAQADEIARAQVQALLAGYAVEER